MWNGDGVQINTCNGFYCDSFSPNSNSKPTMWTEAWSGWFTAFGKPVPHRPVEDLAFAVARFIQKGGSFVNYYMVSESSPLLAYRCQAGSIQLSGHMGQSCHMSCRVGSSSLFSFFLSMDR